MDKEFILTKNQKNKPTIIEDGYRYNLDGKNLISKSTRWRCVNRECCTASVTLNGDQTKIIRRSNHTCERNVKKNNVFMAMRKCKDELCSDLGSVQETYEKNMEPLKKERQSYIDEMPEFSQVKDGLHKLVKRTLESEKLTYKKLKDVKIPRGLSDGFLVAEDGVEEKLLIFSSSVSRDYLDTLFNDECYFGDGTFQACPKPFYQIYSVHLDLGSNVNTNNVVPILYGLLPNKSENTYTRFFTLLKEKLGMNIKQFKCDFEVAVMNAVMNVYPEAEIFGCFYHFQKAIRKKAQNIGLYFDTREGRKLIRLISNLPLIPAENMWEGWNSILNTVQENNEIKQFKNYFLKYWMNKYPLHILSCSTNRHRTTNIVEGWHRRLNSKIPKRPTLFRFIKRIKKEAIHYDYKIKNSLYFSGKKNRRNSDILFDKSYKKYLAQLQQKEMSPLQLIKKVVEFRRKYM